MSNQTGLESIEARHGEKMIELKVRFWTNNIAEGESRVIRKHAWSSGVVRIKPNGLHGISRGKARPFHSLLDIGAAIEKVLIDHGVVLHPSRRAKKYVKSE